MGLKGVSCTVAGAANDQDLNISIKIEELVGLLAIRYLVYYLHLVFKC